jgi:DUF177 domain-containing protein
MSAFTIDVATLRTDAERVELETDATDIGLPSGQWVGRVRGVFQVEKIGEKVSVRGSVRGVAELECVRCLRPFEHPLEVPLMAYVERTGHASRSEEADLERDHDVIFFNGRQLDLGDVARQALLVELPITPHCREDCKGLCPVCGADRNVAPCHCSTGST